MKICFLTLGRFSQFATSKRATGMGESMALLGEDVRIIALDCEENRHRIKREAPHCTAEFFKAKNPITEIIRKIQILHRQSPDYVYVSSYCLRNLAFLRFLLPSKSRLIIEFCELYSAYGHRRTLWRCLEQVAISEADVIVSASLFLQGVLRNRSDKPNLYLPYAYPSYLNPNKKVLNADGKVHVVIMVSLWKDYGIYDVIEAMEYVIKARNNVCLDVIGGGPEKKNLENLVNDRKLMGKINFKGYLPEDKLNDAFSIAAVFLVPMHNSIQDRARCPSKLYYYLPYGKPIVTCRIGEPFKTLGEFGFYYKAGDVDDMGRVIVKAIDACSTFVYNDDLISEHSWDARAKTAKDWLTRDCE